MSIIEAYVFIKCEHARAKQVYDRISTIEGAEG